MNEPKLYRHNESGKIVAVSRDFTQSKCIHTWFRIFNGENSDTVITQSFLATSYTALPEVPKPIIEKLPHEFIKGEEVLVAHKGLKWRKRTFGIFYPYDSAIGAPFYSIGSEWVDFGHKFKKCIPYTGNEHLEGTITDSEHGTAPKDYVPPHIPKLGDADYWQVGDELINLSDNTTATIIFTEKHRLTIDLWNGAVNYISLKGERVKGLLRLWYHKGSYVKPDGTVHEHIPTRYK